MMSKLMKFVLNSKWDNNHQISKFCTKNAYYEIPQKYKNSFYLANALFFDRVCWYVHRGYEVIFQDLVEELQTREPSYTDAQARNKVFSIIDVLEPCKAFIEINFPVKRQFGDYKIVKGYRAHHGLYRDKMVCLGGLRISSGVEEDQIKGLAALATFKYACMGIDMSGSHGGIVANPAEFTDEERKSILKNYAGQLVRKQFCGENADILKPDVNVTAEEMFCISEGETASKNILAVGSPNTGDFEEYAKSTSHCVNVALNVFINNKNILETLELTGGIADKTFILEGLGKIGTSIGIALEEAGAKCVGITERDGFLDFPDGINIKDISRHKDENGTILGFNNKTKPTDGPTTKILSNECDILLLAATHKTVHCHTADRIQAKIIIEAANSAITPVAHRILVSRGKLVLPDIYVTCGSALIAHFEYLKNSQHSTRVLTRSLTRDVFRDLIQQIKEAPLQVTSTGERVKRLVDHYTDRRMVFDAMEFITKQTTRDLLEICEKYNLGLDIRTAAYIKAIRHIFSVIYDSKVY